MNLREQRKWKGRKWEGWCEKEDAKLIGRKETLKLKDNQADTKKGGSH